MINRNFLFLIFFLTSLLCGWQVYRYDTKSKKASIVNTALYTLDSSRYVVPDSSNLSDYLMKKITICGRPVLSSPGEQWGIEKYFLLYKPEHAQIGKNGATNIYSIVFSMKHKGSDQDIIIKYGAFKSINEVKEFTESTNFNKNSCFSGVLLNKNIFTVNKVANFFVTNKSNNGSYLWLDEKQFPWVADSQYILDDQLYDLKRLMPNYKHHMYYAFMWGCIALYVLFFIYKSRNAK